MARLLLLLGAFASAMGSVSFGIYDVELSPGGGWEVMTAADFSTHKAEFIKQYNANKGIAPVKLFKSGNCCFAVKGGDKLTITGTPYGFQFPSSAAGAIKCNPAGGYADKFYGFYRAPTLTASMIFGSKPGCASSHNPAVFKKVSLPATVEFGMFDFAKIPAGGWTLMTSAQLEQHKAQFIAEYNKKNGIAVISTFQSGNCCFAVKGGNKLQVTGTPYGFQFPAHGGLIKCNPAGGYSQSRYHFYRVNTLSASAVFTDKPGCSTSHNPAIFYRQPKAAVALKNKVSFGIYDLELVPSGGWQVMAKDDYTTHKAEFIKQYNAQKGFAPVKLFKSGNCCFAVKGGQKLTISGTPYTYQFPASVSGGIRCNPSGGYSEKIYQFYRTPSIKDSVTFGSKVACATSHNPAIFIKQELPPAAAKIEFGLYDSEQSPGGGWMLMTSNDFTQHKSAFIQHYNTNKGINVIKVFSSGNCCFQVKGKKALVIHGSAYGYQFPASVSGGIRCNPSGGYKESKYQFYKLPTIKASATFGEKAACASSHNPAVFMRGAGLVPPTAAPTFSPTKSPTHSPKHCRVGAWGRWSTCSKTCGTGTRKRVRAVVAKNAHGGNACPTLVQQESCSQGDCPVHCQVSAFGPYSACDAVCGGGMQKRVRQIKELPLHNGDACPHLSESRLCNVHPCPIHCQVTAWNAWSKCDANCGGGLRTRSRRIIVTPQYNGNKCPSLKATSKCNTSPCAVHCQVGTWSGWSLCNAKCGGGLKSRTRKVLVSPKFNGNVCPSLTESAKCNISPCAVHCGVSAWSKWNGCSKSCGGGSQTRDRSVVRFAQFNGQKCPHLSETRPCNSLSCPIDCQVGQFGGWNSCDKTCGIGTQHRARNIVVSPKFGGKACPSLKLSQSCNEHPCPEIVPKDTRRGYTWGNPIDTLAQYPTCVQQCMYNEKCVAITHVTDKSKPTFRNCALLASTTKRDDKNLAYGTWIKGKQTKEVVVTKGWGSISRWVKTGGDYTTVHCPTGTTRVGGGCDAFAKPHLFSYNGPADGSPGGWKCGGFGGAKKVWVLCSDGLGKIHQTTAYPNSASGSSGICPSGFHAMGGGCLNYMNSRKFSRSYPDATRKSWHCSGFTGKKKVVGLCAGDTFKTYYRQATVSSWGSVTCDKGDISIGGGCEAVASPFQVRYSGPTYAQKPAFGAAVKVESSFGGWSCGGFGGQKKVWVSCWKPPVVNCRVSAWSKWSKCSKTCGKGVVRRTRTVLVQPTDDGKACPSLEATQICNVVPCPIHCQVSVWSKWGACSVSCGAGARERTRTVLMETKHGGIACPSLKDTNSCNLHACPVDCQVPAYSGWSKCSLSCGTGYQNRARKISTPVAYGGKLCPSLRQTRKCNTQVCPIDCRLSKYGGFAKCSKTCGDGVQSRFRTIEIAPAFGGLTCAVLQDSRKCNSQACPVDCKVTVWEAWTPCSTTCGAGVSGRARTVVNSAASGGKRCPILKQSRSCTDGPCPVHCEVSLFSAWTPCSKSCSVGMQNRKREILQHAKHGGYVCPFLHDTRMCNTHACPVDCKVGVFGAWGECSVSCGSGHHSRTRKVLKATKRGGKFCPALAQIRLCNVSPCPVDCQVSSFSPWGHCSSSCGSGSQIRRRSVTMAAAFGGSSCPALSQSRGCNKQACPVDCVVSEWDMWSICSKSCGKGTQTRKRFVRVGSAYGGKKCGALLQRNACNAHSCPVDCAVDLWQPWTACSHTCSTGQQSRRRKILVNAANGGKNCPVQSQIQSCSDGPCPVHCAVSAFTQWSTCSLTCGAGTQSRSRTVIRNAEHGGYTCPFLLESRKCNQQACPVDCQMSGWNTWRACSHSCGTGYQSRTRSIVVAVQHGGKECSAFVASRKCNVSFCPIDCVVTKFSAWTSCSLSCGTGHHSRHRSASVPAAYGGRACPKLSQSRNCNTNKCPVDCVMSAWWAWTGCSLSCGSGSQERFRTVNVQAQNGGKICPAQKQKRSCNTQACPVNCKVTSWQSWSECSKSCAVGSQTRSRKVAGVARHGGKACPVLQQSQSCSDGPCPIHCSVSAFSKWSPCTKSCGQGTQSRSRKVLRHAKHGGFTCPFLDETRKCNAHSCPVDCVLSAWESWSVCSQSCGTGSQSRSRSINVANKWGGKLCGSTSQTQKCNAHNCPIDCKLTAFGAWTLCTKTCGGGNQLRRRSISRQAAFGGALCSIKLTEKRMCLTKPCPVDCAVSSYSAWSMCTKSCGVGQQGRTRSIAVQPAHGGMFCPVLQQKKSCNAHECAVDCVVSAYSSWSACTRSCGTGYSTRNRRITRKSAFGGKLCPGLRQTRKCNTQACPIDCVVSKFGKWTVCTKTCGTGSQKRTRSVVVQVAYGGAMCPSMTDNRHCSSINCPVDCEVTAWKPWSACSVTCGNGNQRRTRTISTPMNHGGKACPILRESQRCTDGPCPIHCELSLWTAWAACSRSCNSGIQSRSRSVITHAQHGGYTCGFLREQQSCNAQGCPVDCVVSKFSNWVSCSTSCGGGTQHRTRVIVRTVVNGGVACPALEQTRECNTQYCPIDCVVSGWVGSTLRHWTMCSKTCGTGVQSRRRSVKRAVAYGGVTCPALSQSRGCNKQACPVDCQLTDFSAWSDCTKTCGLGSQVKRRSIRVSAAHGGQACGPLKLTRACNAQHCPINCVVSSWTKWTGCSKSCGAGTHTRTRSVTISPSWGGAKCPVQLQRQSCSNGPCPVHCQVSSFSKWSTCTKTCGRGSQTRTRIVVQHALHGGYVCPFLKETQDCNEQACPVDCQLAGWAVNKARLLVADKTWSACSRSCGTGYQTRSRSIMVVPAHGGKACLPLSQTRKCKTQLCPVDCKMTAFGRWSSCSRSCGQGTRQRRRSIRSNPQNGGKACGNLVEVSNCNSHRCPVDCQVTPFRRWSACSKTCGVGYHSHSREVQIAPRFGGNVCPFLKETRTCNQHACPIDCVISKWGKWSSCTQSCGGGSQMRSRNMKVSSEFGGLKCPSLRAVRGCGSKPCPVHCKVSTWSKWSKCTKTCGVGAQQRTRKIITADSYGGKQCPVLKQHSSCNPQSCPIDCVVSGFGGYSDCTVSCGSGTKTKTRSTIVAPAHGGKKCPSLAVTLICNTQHCPIDCVVSKWTKYGPCSKTCGSGQKHRTRKAIREAQYGGKVCGSYIGSKSCNVQPCPVNCQVGEWSDWSSCTVSCGTGTHKQTRAIKTPAAHGGYICPILSRTEKCNMGSCPVHCVVTKWSAWSPCSVSCGSGQKTRTRAISRVPRHGGYQCPKLNQIEPCNIHACPIDCEVTAFKKWTACTKSCGKGTQRRNRHVAVAVANGGKKCPVLKQTRACNTFPCPIDCVVTGFGSFGACSQSCGPSGTKKRTRAIETDVSYGGKKCTSLVHIQPCNAQACPVDCKMGAWGRWSRCSKTCGEGHQTRLRGVQAPARFGGKACGKTKDTQNCAIVKCPVHCQMSAFGAWTGCTKTCGSGTQFRTRTVRVSKAHGGNDCPARKELRECNRDECPIDCTVSSFTKWSICSHSCGTGSQSRSRSIMRAARFGGKKCGSLTHRAVCNQHACPTDCIHTKWQKFESCTRTCGGGSQVRRRSVKQAAVHGGRRCGALAQLRTCNVQSCPVDCVLSPWESWSACSLTCGIGFTMRGRSIKQAAAYGGVACGVRSQMKHCNTHNCPIDCRVGGWQPWLPCSRTCGKGTQTRKRIIIREETYGGKGCPSLRDSKSCAQGPCPVHCDVSSFSFWSKCTKSCGSGIQNRSRKIVRHAKHGGYVCPALHQRRKCNEQNCPVDCQMTQWSTWTTCSRTCGTGYQKRARSVISERRFGGRRCHPHDLNAERACNPVNCPIDCIVSGWSAYSSCSRTCGTGVQSRRRSVERQVAYGGKGCPILQDSRACGQTECPIHCEVGKWSQWSQCTSTCGAGNQRRFRNILVEHAYGGALCPSLVHARRCNTARCPVDCQTSDWSFWGACSRSCNTGTQLRHRKITQQVAFGGKSCPTLSQSKKCKTFLCPIDCRVSGYTSWTPCSKSCSSGSQSRSRVSTQAAMYGGKKCPALIDARTCNSKPCPIDCKLAPWRPWSECTKSCGTGNQRRIRHAAKPMHGGKECPALSQSRTCNKHGCPIDCHVSRWGTWSQCSKSCGSGTQTRTRSVTTDQSGGQKCPSLINKRSCNPTPCPADCELSKWSRWSECSISCGTGKHTRHRKVVKAPIAGGKPCGIQSEVKPCNNGYCHICSHVRCDFEQKRKGATGHFNHGKYTLRVKHFGEERHGDHHDCKVDEKTSTCQCICRSRAWLKKEVAPANRS